MLLSCHSIVSATLCAVCDNEVAMYFNTVYSTLTQVLGVQLVAVPASEWL